MGKLRNAWLVPLVAWAMAPTGAAALPAQAGKKAAGAGTGEFPASGTFELGLSGLFDLNKSNQTAAYVAVRLGYFVDTGLELGISALEGTTPDGQRDVTGLFAEYDLATASRFVPFWGMSLQHAAPPVGGDGEDARIVTAYGGATVVIGPGVALALTAAWAFADHAVLGPLSQRVSSDRDLSLGLRCFF